MQKFYRNLFIILTLFVYIQLIMSYPSSNINEQRSFLRCHFSAIACKRSLSFSKENQILSSTIHKNQFQLCIQQNKPFWFCLNHSQPPHTSERDMNKNR